MHRRQLLLVAVALVSACADVRVRLALRPSADLGRRSSGAREISVQPLRDARDPSERDLGANRNGVGNQVCRAITDDDVPGALTELLIEQLRLAGAFRNFWDQFHGWFVAITLAGAIVLTVYSLLVYLYRYRALLKVSR